MTTPAMKLVMLVGDREIGHSILPAAKAKEVSYQQQCIQKLQTKFKAVLQNQKPWFYLSVKSKLS